jgi:hypothetical protein
MSTLYIRLELSVGRQLYCGHMYFTFALNARMSV